MDPEKENRSSLQGEVPDISRRQLTRAAVSSVIKNLRARRKELGENEDQELAISIPHQGRRYDPSFSEVDLGRDSEEDLFSATFPTGDKGGSKEKPTKYLTVVLTATALAGLATAIYIRQKKKH